MHKSAVPGGTIYLVWLLLGNLCDDHRFVQRPFILSCSGLQKRAPSVRTSTANSTNQRQNQHQTGINAHTTGTTPVVLPGNNNIAVHYLPLTYLGR